MAHVWDSSAATWSHFMASRLIDDALIATDSVVKIINAIRDLTDRDRKYLFKALRQVKFPADGALSLEYEANPANPIDDMKACLEVAKEAIAKVG